MKFWTELYSIGLNQTTKEEATQKRVEPITKETIEVPNHDDEYK